MNERFLRDIETGVIHQSAFDRQQPMNSPELALCGESFRHRSWELTKEGATCIGCIGYVKEWVTFSAFEDVGVGMINTRALHRLELAEDTQAAKALGDAFHQGFQDGFNGRLQRGQKK